MFGGEKNKDRIYVAFYQPEQDGPLPLHSGILRVPKQSPRHSHLYHAIPVNDIHDGIMTTAWEYSSVDIDARDSKLIALVLLGKLPSRFLADDVDTVLSTVPRQQQNDYWSCVNWVCDAINVRILIYLCCSHLTFDICCRCSSAQK